MLMALHTWVAGFKWQPSHPVQKGMVVVSESKTIEWEIFPHWEIKFCQEKLFF